MMRRNGGLLPILLMLLLALTIGACGGRDEGSGANDDKPRSADTKRDDDEAGGDDLPKPGEVVDSDVGVDPADLEPVGKPDNQKDPDANPKPGSGDLVITTPSPFTTVVGKVAMRATVPYVAGMQATWSLTRGDGKALVEDELKIGPKAAGVATASGTAVFTGAPAGSYELHVTTFDADGEQLDDALVPITIVDRLDPGATDPNAPPPGGDPTS